MVLNLDYICTSQIMKLKKSTYFAFLFLLGFLTSFGINTYQTSSFSQIKENSTFSKDLQIASSTNSAAAQDNLLFEENENETEDGFELQSYTLPFFIAHFQYKVSNSKFISAQPLAEKQTNPIYISVCNFRI